MPKRKGVNQGVWNEEIVFSSEEIKLQKPKSTYLPSSDYEIFKDVAHQLGKEVNEVKTGEEKWKSTWNRFKAFV